VRHPSHWPRLTKASASKFTSVADAESRCPLASVGIFTRTAYELTNSDGCVIVAAKRATVLRHGSIGFGALIAGGNTGEVHPTTQRLTPVKVHKAPRTEGNEIDPSTGQG
jgi:hypothetical protein